MRKRTASLRAVALGLIIVLSVVAGPATPAVADPTNTVTWSGLFTEERDGMVDGDSFTYSQDETVGNYTIEVIGNTTTEWANVTSDGTGVYYAGDENLAGKDTPFTGYVQNTSDVSVPIGGTKAPTGPDGNASPRLRVTGINASVPIDYSVQEIGGENFPIGDPVQDPSFVDTVHYSISTYGVDYDGDNTFRVYLTIGSTTHILGTHDLAAGEEVSGTTSVDDSNPAPYDDVELSIDSLGSAPPDAASFDDSNTEIFTGPPTGVIVTAGNDTGSGAHTDVATWNVGDLSHNQTVTNSSFSIPAETDSIEVVATGGAVSWNLSAKEHMQTTDPVVSVNGNDAGGASVGTLTDGQTQALTTDTGWVSTSSTNTVEVTLPDAEDGPAPAVDLLYAHDGVDESTVEYSGQWNEHYEVSKTFTQSSDGGQLTIPFDNTVYQAKNVEKQVNSGSFSTVEAGNQSFSDETLTVDLGSISADDEITIRADGARYDVNNGSISVTTASPTDGDLRTSITLDSWASDSYIAVEDTGSGTLVNYPSGESWSAADGFSRFEPGVTQHLHMPNADQGGSVQINTIPVSVTPASGDVDIRVETVDNIEPEFVVSPGTGLNTEVTYTFEEATSGKHYLLYSTTVNEARDSGTASSPISLQDDDSAETLEFRISDSPPDSGSGAGGGIGGAEARTVVNQTVAGVPAWAVILGLGVLGLAYVAYGRGRTQQAGQASGIRGRVTSALGRFGRFVLSNRLTQLVLGGLGLLALVQAGALPATFVQVAAFLAVPPVVWWFMQRTGNLDRRVLAGVTAVSLVFAAETISPGALLGPIGENIGDVIGVVGPILAVAAIYIAWRWTRNDRPTFVVQADEGDGNR